MNLNKTRFLAGLQCEKHLHLLVHHPEFASKNDSPASVTGRVVGRHARQNFPGGVLIARGGSDADPFAQTASLLGDEAVASLFEAGFHTGDLEVFVDILQRNQDAWDVIEVKASTSVKDHHIDDVTIQALALSRAGIRVRGYYLMHVNKGFIYQGGHDYVGLLVEEDITERVLAHMGNISGAVERFTRVLAEAQPDIHMGSHCKKPNPCEFIQHCAQHDTRYPVSSLPNGHVVARTLIADGIYDIRDIPADLLTSETHLWVYNVTVSGQAELRPGAKQVLTALDYPRYYLDFESIQFAIPIWTGTSPYQQLPFQWSCHVENASGALEHKEFLDVSGEDPRRGFTEALIEVCGQHGPIIVYNQAFEKRIIRELAAVFPDMSEQLLALNERVFDLLPVVKRNYYHPEMKGSWSIKKVLPCLVPELNYSDLGSIQDGIQAQSSYLAIIGNEMSAAEKRQQEVDLREYCKLDTTAMVMIMRRMCDST